MSALDRFYCSRRKRMLSLGLITNGHILIKTNKTLCTLKCLINGGVQIVGGGGGKNLGNLISGGIKWEEG